ncbi:MAG: MutS-related protein [Romboutsia sp.]|uniref:lysine 5,6-aminomutase reactivase ATPase KamC n=1 Tax=Romboutsia sp. TaxID=1965302 RepID=UPI003F3D9360
MFKKSNCKNLIKELDYIELIKLNILENKDLIKDIEYNFCKIKELKNTIKRIVNKAILDEVELFEIKNFSINTNEIIKLYEKLNINIDYIAFEKLNNIVKLLDPDNLNLATFRIYDSYSDKLTQIRKLKSIVEGKIFKLSNINQNIKNSKSNTNLSYEANKISELDEIDVNESNKVNGINEEYNIEKLKAKRSEIIANEEEESLEVRKILSYELFKNIDEIKKNIKSIGKLDFLIAKANLAIKYKGIKPQINNENKIQFYEVINPSMLEILAKQNKNYMPISIDMNKKITLISGANMGGKSVSMKTIALNLYLFQCGFYVFAKEANLCVLDFIYLVSDDMQDINKGLSTFGGEIIKLKEITKIMKLQDGFIALDEFARGTNPIEGRLLLKSICTYFKKFNSINLISTHYDDISIDDIDYYQVIGLKNVDFEGLRRKIDFKISSIEMSRNKVSSIDILQEYMDYRLEKVNKEAKVPKDAINICKLLGLENEIIEIAKELSENIYKGDDYE